MTVDDAMKKMYPRKPTDRQRYGRALHLREDFGRDDAGNPLGRGMPLGRSLRFDGESHRTAWMRILRDDPCAYCDAIPSGTVDHIEPRSRPVHGPGGAHTWANFTGACERCNQRKGARPLLLFLAVRATSFPKAPPSSPAPRWSPADREFYSRP